MKLDRVDLDLRQYIRRMLARADMAAFETQGRFIQSRYKDEELN